MDTPLPCLVQDTSTLPEQDRFEIWSKSLAGVFRVPPPAPSDEARFHVHSEIWHLGEVLTSTSAFSTPQSGVRDARMARTDQMDHYRLVLQLEGCFRLHAEGQSVEAMPGQAVIMDFAHAQSFDRDPGRSIFLFIPRELLDDALPPPLHLHGARPQGAAAALLSDYLQNLLRHLPAMGLAEAPAMARAAVSMVAAALAPTAHTLAMARPSLEATLLRQIFRYVDLHLTEDDLSPQSICSFFKISRATLYRMFEPLGGVAAYVKERRLVRIHDILCNSDRRQYLARLAQDHGFRSAAHFSSAFKQMFGYSPREVRLPSDTQLAAQRALPSSEPHFRNWLHSLQR